MKRISSSSLRIGGKIVLTKLLRSIVSKALEKSSPRMKSCCLKCAALA